MTSASGSHINGSLGGHLGAYANSGEDSRLWGRSAEREVFEQHLEAALAGQPRLLCVKGEAGIGKTRLTEVLEERGQALGFATHRARFWEGAAALPLWNWKQLFQSLGLSLPEGPGEWPSRSAAGRGQTAGTAPSGPLLLVLEDIHHADPFSMRLLSVAVRELHGSSVALAVTYREAEALESGNAAVLAELEPEARVLHLRRLDPVSTAQWVRWVLGKSDARLEEAVFRLSEGVPLFVEEILHLPPRQLERLVSSGGSGPVPFGVRHLLQQRIEGLSPETRGLLAVASVLGASVDPELLRHIWTAGSLSPIRFESVLSAAMRTGTLVEAGGQLRFSHALLREAAGAELTEEGRRQIHRLAIARLLHVPEPPAEAVCFHLLEAFRDDSDLEPLTRWALIAAEEHHRNVEHRDAVRLLERVRRVLERRSVSVPDDLLLALAHGLTLVGSHAKARALCMAVAERARRTADGCAFAKAALQYAEEFDLSQVNPQMVSLLEEACSRIPDREVGLGSQVLARLAAAQQPNVRPSEPVALARQAIQLARRTGDPATLLAVLHTALAAMMDFADARERMALNLEALALARRLKDPPRQLRAHMRLVIDSIEVGDLGALDGHISAFEELARRHDQASLIPVAFVFRSMRAASTGNAATANRWIEEAASLYEGVDLPLKRWLALHRVGVALTTERVDESERLAELLAMEWGPDSFWHLFRPPVRAVICSRANRLEEVSHWLQQCSKEPVLLEDVSASVMIAEAVARVGSPDDCRRAFARLLPRSGALQGWSIVGCICDGTIDRVLALLASGSGDGEKAELYFERAKLQARSLGLRPHLARVLYEQAAALVQRGEAAEERRIRPLLEESRALSQTLMLSTLLEHIEALDEALGSPDEDEVYRSYESK